MPFPGAVEIELATLVDRPPDGDDWLVEAKYDGYRLLLALDGDACRAFTRSHADWTERFAPLVRAVRSLPATSAILDGEAVVFDEAGISRFGLLQKALSEHPERLGYAAFDLLYLNGYDLRELPLAERKELLRTLLAEQPADSPVRYAEHTIGGAAEFYRQACSADLEGIVCKRIDSRYVAGRGRDWQKVKCRQSQELVVGGFTEGAGSRSALGSLLVGYYDGDRLTYAGRVGTGFDEATIASLRTRLEADDLAKSPFDHPPRIRGHVVHWAEPRMVIEVAFREWTAEGVLRQPVFLGVREDKAPGEVIRERPREDAPHSAQPASTAPADHGRPITVAGVRVTNPDKRLFPDSEFTKAEFARYYEAIASWMLPEVANRPLTLVRCPVGHGRGCFYQRHPDAGLPAQVHRLPYTLKNEAVELLYVDSAEGLIALAQMGAGEVHTWLSRTDAPARPDRICLDLDPGPDVTWPQIRATGLLVREECSALGFSAFVKSTGSKGRPSRGTPSGVTDRQDGQGRARRARLPRLPAQRRGRERRGAVLDADAARAAVCAPLGMGRVDRRLGHPRVYSSARARPRLGRSRSLERHGCGQHRRSRSEGGRLDEVLRDDVEVGTLDGVGGLADASALDVDRHRRKHGSDDRPKRLLDLCR